MTQKIAKIVFIFFLYCILLYWRGLNEMKWIASSCMTIPIYYDAILPYMVYGKNIYIPEAVISHI